MSTIRIIHDKDYTKIANAAIKDKRLSFKARGVHHLLLSYPDNWVVNMNHLIGESDRDGRDAIYSAISELKDLGYVVRRRIRKSGGMIDWETEVHELPVDISDDPTAERFPPETTTGKPGSGKKRQSKRVSSTSGFSVNGSPVSGLSVNGSPVSGLSVNGKPVDIINNKIVITEELITEEQESIPGSDKPGICLTDPTQEGESNLAKPEETIAKVSPQNKKAVESQIRNAWFDDVFVPNYPYRLTPSGQKVRELGKVIANRDHYLRMLPVKVIESGQATDSLRGMILAKMQDYFHSTGIMPEKVTPRGQDQEVFAIPFVPDPCKWFTERRWMSDVQPKSENQPTPSTLPEWITSPDDRFLSWLCSTHLPQLPGYPNKDIAVSTAKHWLEVARQQPEHFGRAAIAWEAFSGSKNGSKNSDSDRGKNWYEKEIWANSWQEFSDEATKLGVKIRPQPGVGAYFYYTLPGSNHEDRLGFSTNDRTCRVLLDAWRKRCSPEAATA
jgi:hypothetical protein